MEGRFVTTGLSDKQLAEAFDKGFTTASNKGSRYARHEGFRAVADLAITHADSEIHGLREELRVAEDQANNLAGDNAVLSSDLERLRMALTEAQRK